MCINAFYEKCKNKTKKNEKVETLKQSIEIEKQLTVQASSHYNENLIEKKKEIAELKKQNNILVEQLKKFKIKLNDHIKEAKKYFDKREQLDKEEQYLNKLIQIKDKEIKLAQRNSYIYQKDYEMEKKNFEKNENIDVDELALTLEDLNKQIFVIEAEIKQLNEIKNQHAFCQKKNNSLSSKLNILTNSYEFELKKSNMLNETEPTIKTQDSLNKNNSEKIYRNVSYNLLSNNSYQQYVKKLFSMNSNNINETDSPYYNNSNNMLFNSNEKNVLEKIVPNIYLNLYNERFQSLNQEKLEIMDLLEENDDKKQNIIKTLQNKIDHSKLKLKETKKISVDLNLKISKESRKIMDIKTQLSKLNKEYKKYKNILQNKENINNKIKEQIDEVKNKKASNKKDSQVNTDGNKDENNKEEEMEEEGEEDDHKKEYTVEKQVKLNYS